MLKVKLDSLGLAPSLLMATIYSQLSTLAALTMQYTTAQIVYDCILYLSASLSFSHKTLRRLHVVVSLSPFALP
ncbi:hypothetical protein EDD18DRAFT_339581 [Armillaria luteobubalina]|uniref:Uncharacterized protein n=1 Tax=Armillaria luteobubalina TaxID=153913 RepID=A0AA39QM93_9AGAR|nr:hypothetical protein EDD18DRAFT_339581 [Armillaria luteobubalina]